MSGGWVWFCALVFYGSRFGVRSDTTFNFTYGMAHQCKEHVSSNGYRYSPFYRITPRPDQDNYTLLDMHIAVLAPRDGHVLLSTREEPDVDEPVYEIVLGGGGNRFSEIRRHKKRDTKISHSTKDVLSAIDFRAFWIKITDDGAVDVGREGELLPFLHYEDAEPLPIKFFSFATWTGVEAKFLYDCPSPAQYNTTGTSSQSEMTTPHLTTSQKLISQLMSSRNVLTPPNSTVTVSLAVLVASVTYDPATSILHTIVSVGMTWNDANMKWNPDEYNGTTTLRVEQGQVWKPELYLHNSVEVGELSALGSEPVYIRNSGEISLHMRSSLSSWCEDDDIATGTLQCMLVIAPWEQHEQIELELQDDGVGMETGATEATVSNSWRLVMTKYILSSLELSPYSNITCAQSGIEQEQAKLLMLQLTMRLQRPDKQALLTPLLLSMVSIVLWLSPARPSTGDRVRLCLPAVVCVLLSALTLTIQDIPSNIVPLYEIVLVSCAASLASGLVARALTAERMSGLARLVCRTPSEAYSTFTALERESDRVEVETQEPRNVRDKVLFIVDCVFSMTYCVLYAVLLAYYK